MRTASASCLPLFASVLSASATPIQIEWGLGGGNYQCWGPDFVRSFNLMDEVVTGTLRVSAVSTAFVSVAPTLQSHELVGDGSVARYTGGVLEIRGGWGSQEDQLSGLLMRVSILELVIEVSESKEADIIFGDMYFTLGQGELDADIARQLRVPRRILGGEYWIGMDYVSPPFRELGEQWERSGSWNGTDLELQVPEPSTALLLVAGAVATLARRFRRRR